MHAIKSGGVLRELLVEVLAYYYDLELMAAVEPSPAA
jgi:hypothetical protein